MIIYDTKYNILPMHFVKILSFITILGSAISKEFIISKVLVVRFPTNLTPKVTALTFELLRQVI